MLEPYGVADAVKRFYWRSFVIMSITSVFRFAGIYWVELAWTIVHTLPGQLKCS